jgi:Endonuclease/Exonuclease/phosphatase family
MKQLGRGGLAVFLTCLFLTGAATEVRATPITVMTQNLYLGTDTAGVIAGVPGAVGAALGSVIANNFPARAGAIANEIVNAGAPLLIGLQEAYTISGPVTLDYTQILLNQLAAQGLNYSIVGSHTDAAVTVVDSTFGTITATDHDVVLALTGVPGFVINGSSGHTFVNNVVLDPTAVGPLPLNRGYVSVDASLDGLPFQFISTHLDEFNMFDQAQVGEILAGLPSSTGLQLIVGDFNSTPSSLAYAAMVAAGFIDTAAANGVLGFTCCQDPDLNNSVSALDSRIDYVFERNFGSIPSALLVGNTPFESDRPQWPSDHAGLVATVEAPEPPTATLFFAGLIFLGFRKFSPWRRWVRA